MMLFFGPISKDAKERESVEAMASSNDQILAELQALAKELPDTKPQKPEGVHRRRLRNVKHR